MNTLFNLEKVLSFFSTIFYFFMTNLLFILFNIPLVYFILFAGISRIGTYLPLFLVCLIPTAPALAALFYSMRQFVVHKDTSIFRPWLKGFKTNFKTAFLVGILQLLTIFILASNIRIFTFIYPILPIKIIFTVLLGIVLLSIPYAYLLIMRFYMPVLGTLKTSIALVFNRPVLSICNMMIFFFVLMLFELSAGTTVLFMSTLYAFFILMSNRHLLKKIEEKAEA